MLSHTRRALEDFDNQHDFERLAADVLNALGYADVEPIAPRGGADGGCDIRFRTGDAPGVGFVTLDKDITTKFKSDLAKQGESEGHIALFCNVDVTPKKKLAFTRQSIEINCTLEIFDLERLRSLLDTSLKDIRRRYLGIDDAIAAKVRSDVRKLVRFPGALPDERNETAGMLECMFVNQLPRRLFDYLMAYNEQDIREIEGIGETLQRHIHKYYAFRQEATRVEQSALQQIGTIEKAQFREAWEIHFRYSLMRFAGLTQDDIKANGNFLNYGISWDSAEKVFVALRSDTSVASPVSTIFQNHTMLTIDLSALTDNL